MYRCTMLRALAVLRVQATKPKVVKVKTPKKTPAAKRPKAAKKPAAPKAEGARHSIATVHVSNQETRTHLPQ